MGLLQNMKKEELVDRWNNYQNWLNKSWYGWRQDHSFWKVIFYVRNK